MVRFWKSQEKKGGQIWKSQEKKGVRFGKKSLKIWYLHASLLCTYLHAYVYLVGTCKVHKKVRKNRYLHTWCIWIYRKNWSMRIEHKNWVNILLDYINVFLQKMQNIKLHCTSPPTPSKMIILWNNQISIWHLIILQNNQIS